MTKRILLALVVLNSLFLISALENLSLDRAKEIVLEQNLDYLSVQTTRDRAVSSEKSAFYSFLPNATLSGSHVRYEPEVMQSGVYSNQVSLSVNQAILANGSIYYNNKIQRENRLSAETNVKQKRIELMNQVEVLYYNALESQKNLEIAKSNLERAQKAYDNGKIKFNQSVISKDQLLRLQVDVTNKAINHLNNKNTYSDAYRALKVYLNSSNDFLLSEINFQEIITNLAYQDLASKFSLDENATLIKGNMAYNKLLKEVTEFSEQENPQIANAKSAIKLATYSLRQQQSSFLPTLNLTLNKSWSASEKADDFQDQASLMLNASLAIFPLVNKYHNVNGQKMNLKAANYNYQSIKNSLVSNIETSLNSYLIALEKIELAKQTLDLNEEIFKQKTAMYESNLISVDDYLDAQVEMDQAQVQYNSSVYGYLKTESSLCRVIGMEDTDDLAKIINLVLEER